MRPPRGCRVIRAIASIMSAARPAFAHAGASLAGTHGGLAWAGAGCVFGRRAMVLRPYRAVDAVSGGQPCARRGAFSRARGAQAREKYLGQLPAGAVDAVSPGARPRCLTSMAMPDCSRICSGRPGTIWGARRCASNPCGMWMIRCSAGMALQWLLDLVDEFGFRSAPGASLLSAG